MAGAAVIRCVKKVFSYVFFGCQFLEGAVDFLKFFFGAQFSEGAVDFLTIFFAYLYAYTTPSLISYTVSC